MADILLILSFPFQRNLKIIWFKSLMNLFGVGTGDEIGIKNDLIIVTFP